MGHLAIDVVKKSFFLGGEGNLEVFLVEVVIEGESVGEENVKARC